MGGVVLKAKDLNKAPDNESRGDRQLTGTEVVDLSGQKEFALDVCLKAAKGDFASEKTPLNVKELGEMVAEDITSATDDITPLTPAEISVMFDKNPATFYTLEDSHVLTLNFKKPFNIAYVKVLDLNNEVLAITMSGTDVLGAVIPITSNPGSVLSEIKSLAVTCPPAGGDVDIAEIILETFQPTVVTIPPITLTPPPESAPWNCQPLEEIVWEDIMSFAGFEMDSRPQKLFDKKTGGYPLYAVSLLAEAIWSFKLKKPFRIKEVKIINENGTAFIGDDTYFTYFDIYGNGTAVPLSSSFQPIAIDKEITSFYIDNTGGIQGYVSEIILELFLDRRVFPQDPDGLPVQITPPPESAPFNVVELGELVREDFPSIIPDFPPEPQNYDYLFDKNQTTFVTIPQGNEIIMSLKKPFRVKDIKIRTIGGKLRVTYQNYAQQLAGETTVVDFPAENGWHRFTVGDEIFNFMELINTGQGDMNVYEVIIEKFLDQRVFAPESAPLNTQPLEELVWEDIATIAGLEEGQNAEILFDKKIATIFTLAHGQTVTFTLKKPFRLKELKFIEASGFQIFDPTLHIEVSMTRGGTLVYTADRQPMELEEEVHKFSIANTSPEFDLLISQIIADMFLDVRVFAPESEPLNTQPLGELVYADMQSITGIDPGRRAAALFDKSIGHLGLTPLPLPALGTWTFNFRKPFRVKDIKILSQSPYGQVIVNEDVNLTITDVLGNVTVIPLAAGALPYMCDTEIIIVSLANNGTGDQPVDEIIIETFQDVRQHIQLDGRTFFSYDDGAENGETPLTDAYVLFDWTFLSQSFDLKNDETDGGAVIYWSWDGLADAGFLNPGETWHEQCHKRGVYLKASVADALYRLWAR